VEGVESYFAFVFTFLTWLKGKSWKGWFLPFGSLVGQKWNIFQLFLQIWFNLFLQKWHWFFPEKRWSQRTDAMDHRWISFPCQVGIFHVFSVKFVWQGCICWGGVVWAWAAVILKTRGIQLWWLYDQLFACLFVSKFQCCSSNGLEMASFQFGISQRPLLFLKPCRWLSLLNSGFCWCGVGETRKASMIFCVRCQIFLGPPCLAPLRPAGGHHQNGFTSVWSKRVRRNFRFQLIPGGGEVLIMMLI
jgi:hypothetical protein